MDYKELNRLAYERYPINEKERTCWQEKQRRNELREAYKKRLSDQERENKICGTVRETDKEV
jgi:hypothetical protein